MNPVREGWCLIHVCRSQVWSRLLSNPQWVLIPCCTFVGSQVLKVFGGQTVVQLLIFHEMVKAHFSHPWKRLFIPLLFFFLCCYEVVLFLQHFLCLLSGRTLLLKGYRLWEVVLLLPLVSLQMPALISSAVISSAAATPRYNCTRNITINCFTASDLQLKMI